MLFSELIRNIHLGLSHLTKDESEILVNCFKNPAVENLIPATQSVSSRMLSDQSIFFIEELPGVFNDSFFRELNEAANLLDDLTSDLTIAERSRSLEQALISILKKISFLAKYRFVNVDSIEVNKPRFRQATFEHKLHILNSADNEFRLHKESLSEFSDSHAILLMKSIKDPNQFLNLSPFVIDTHTERMNNKDISNYKKDVYLFTQFDRDRLVYTGIESCTTNDLSFLENYSALITDFNELLTLIEQQR